MTPDRVEQGLKLLSFLEQANPARRVWDYKTNPSHLFDKTLWPVLRPLMDTRAQGKISQWWHWHDLPENFSLDGTVLAGNPESFSIESNIPLISMLKNIRMSLGGWQVVYIIGPRDAETLDKGWRYAFSEVDDRSKGRFCSIILNTPVRILAGPDDFVVGGIKAADFQQVPLSVVGPFPARAALPIV